MEAGWGSLGFGFLAGLLSTLSPCVLPILPVVLGSALAAHRFGMLALAAGLIVSFVAVGLFVATLGFSLGLDNEVFRVAAAVLLALLGLVLLSGALQQRLAVATSGMGDVGNRMLEKFTPRGAHGQFAVGLVLGAVWSPCVGPTLGAASLLAAQGENLGAVAAVMAAFAAGASVPLVIVGMASREGLKRWRARLMGAGSAGKSVLGVGVLAVALLILTGTDKAVEAALLGIAPGWLIDLTTRY